MVWQALIGPVASLIDKLIPDKEAAAKAKLELAKEENQVYLKEMEVAMSAILAEAQSSDKWTSRARPSFLYVIYILILASLPMAVVHTVSPDTAKGLIEGFHGWLAAIPEPYLTLFGAGYLGYAAARTGDKWTGKTK